MTNITNQIAASGSVFALLDSSDKTFVIRPFYRGWKPLLQEEIEERHREQDKSKERHREAVL